MAALDSSLVPDRVTWTEAGPAFQIHYGMPLTFRRYYISGVPGRSSPLVVKRYDLLGRAATTLLALNESGAGACLVVLAEMWRRDAAPNLVLAQDVIVASGERAASGLVAVWAPSDAAARDLWEMFQGYNLALADGVALSLDDVRHRAEPLAAPS